MRSEHPVASVVKGREALTVDQRAEMTNCADDSPARRAQAVRSLLGVNYSRESKQSEEGGHELRCHQRRVRKVTQTEPVLFFSAQLQAFAKSSFHHQNRLYFSRSAHIFRTLPGSEQMVFYGGFPNPASVYDDYAQARPL